MNQLKPDASRAYQGGYFRSLITPEQTNNSLALIEFTLPKGAEPPLHIHHDEDESFYIVDGVVKFRVGETETILRAGEALFAPKLVPHAFQIVTDTVIMLNLITPGNLWNYFMLFSSPLEQLPERLPFGAKPDKETILTMLRVIHTEYNVHFPEEN